jgi:adenine-specific DNA-methyltransferase
MTSGLLIQGGGDTAIRTLTTKVNCRGEVMCAYLHPPYHPQRWDHENGADRVAWLGMMRTRLRLVRDLLAPDGSVWIFLNDDRLADCRVLMDKIFGRSNFVATVVIRRPFGPLGSRHLAVNHDYLLIFARNATIWSSNTIPRTDEPDSTWRNPDNDPRGLWRSDILFRPDIYRVGLRYELTSPHGTVTKLPEGRSWKFSQQRFEELDRDKRIWWGEGLTPRLKRFHSERPDPIPLTVWDPADVGSFLDGRRELRKLLNSDQENFESEPERLLHRVITVSTKPGDLVLDCFGQAGTATAVAHKMGRRWITVADESYDIRPRLDKVIAGEDPGGITELAAWSGGGSYEVITAVPSATEGPEETISLAEAIADGRVPTPVYAYREDGDTKLKTRLADACLLREGEENEWSGMTPPRLFVVCEKSSEFDEVAAILTGDDNLPGNGRVVRATDSFAGTEVRAVIGNAEDAVDITDIAVVASYHPLSPEVLGRVLISLSGAGRVHLIVHDAYADLLAEQDKLFERRLPASSLRDARPAGTRQGHRLAPIHFPLRVREAQGERFSLSHVSDEAARTAGRTVRHEFPVPLLRQELYAERTLNDEIARGTRPLDPGATVERFSPVTDVRKAVETKVHRLVESASEEVNGAKRITEQFFLGAGVTTDSVPWSERRKQLAITTVTRLIAGVRKGRRPGSQWAWQTLSLPPWRPAPPSTKNNWTKKFSTNVSYDGWTKSIDPTVSFDAKSTEFRIARLCEDTPSVARWLRLNGRSAYIEMENGMKYYPDFIVVDVHDTHWLVETKADRDIDRLEVRAKRAAAEEWATFVRDHGEFGVWRSLFVTASAIEQALSWDELVARAQPIV